MKKDIMEKTESGDLLNLTEENLMEILDDMLFYKNIPKYGDATETLIQKLAEYMKKQGLSKEALWQLDDYVCNATSEAGSYGYQKGFKDGIILFRTLMKL